MIIRRFYLLALLVVLFFSSTGFGPGPTQIYSQAIEFAQSDQTYFAFMYFNQLLRSHPESRYRPDALFAVGEYYYRISSREEARKMFEAFLEAYPDAKQSLYALVYLLKMAEEDRMVDSIQKLTKQVVDLQRVSFVFRQTKETSYHSPLNQDYKAVIHIDKIEFYLEGKLFAKVSF
jgi:outer membrane protein assembly factor BamD (BamD/ComL family)